MIRTNEFQTDGLVCHHYSNLSSSSTLSHLTPNHNQILSFPNHPNFQAPNIGLSLSQSIFTTTTKLETRQIILSQYANQIFDFSLMEAVVFGGDWNRSRYDCNFIFLLHWCLDLKKFGGVSCKLDRGDGRMIFGCLRFMVIYNFNDFRFDDQL